MNTPSVRKEVRALSDLGVFPPEAGAKPELIMQFEGPLRAIQRPLSDEEARLLIKSFGSDGCFGAASFLMHLIETAPGWPLKDCLVSLDNEWVLELRDRAIRGGKLPADRGPGMAG